MTGHRFNGKRVAASGAVALLLGTAAVVGPVAASAATPRPNLPQAASARAAANWLAGLITPGGFIPSINNPVVPNLDATANTVLALASAGVDQSQAVSALTFLEAHANDYATVTSADGPGQLALLILDAHAMNVAPRSFGGTDLVARLLATQRSTGTDAGLFGSQDPSFDGAYRQGLSLAALAAAGVTTGSAVISGDAWLTRQQCPDGGWTSYISTFNPCNGKPANFAGPDTNSTALAVQGLEAQRALNPKASGSALHFLARAQDADGGWSYEPNTPNTPGSTDPDSTALVLQALLSLGASPSSAKFTKGSSDPVATLSSFQITSGANTGALAFPGIPGANQLATYQAVPALAGVTFAYNLGSPVITKVAPSRGGVAGGAVVHLTGSGLVEAVTVHFGTTPASSFIINSATSITAVAPPGAMGVVDVTVTSLAGSSPVSSVDHFTYKG
jgi:hypothetical protein